MKNNLPVLKINEGILKGGFKSLTDSQKGKIKAGLYNSVCHNRRNCLASNGICL